MTPFTFTSQQPTVHCNPPYLSRYLFGSSLWDLLIYSISVRTRGFLFYSTGYNPLLPLSWAARAPSYWLLCPFDMTSLVFFRNFLVSGIKYSRLFFWEGGGIFPAQALELPISLRNPGFCSWGMVSRSWGQGSRCAHCYWGATASRPFQRTELGSHSDTSHPVSSHGCPEGLVFLVYTFAQSYHTHKVDSELQDPHYSKRHQREFKIYFPFSLLPRLRIVKGLCSSFNIVHNCYIQKFTAFSPFLVNFCSSFEMASDSFGSVCIHD